MEKKAALMAAFFSLPLVTFPYFGMSPARFERAGGVACALLASHR